MGFVEHPIRVLLIGRLRDLHSVLVGQSVKDVDVRRVRRPVATPKKLPSLAPYETDFHLNPTSFALTDELQCPANNVGIERTTQPSVARDDDDSEIVVGRFCSSRCKSRFTRRLRLDT